jgi:hypothetical protein
MSAKFAAAVFWVCFVGSAFAHGQDPGAVRSAQQPGTGVDAALQAARYPIQLDIPVPERVFRIESEAALRERIRQEYRQRGDRAQFPQVDPLGPTGVYAGRQWPTMATYRVPPWVCYNPLYFEDLNTERYGWDLCIFQPIVSTGKFYLDTLLWPYNIGVNPPWACEFNTGYYLPGDEVPYFIYVPPWSWKGAALETAVAVGGVAIFP